jgi:YgiT-type zinc finger domain-containing protein
MTEPENDLELPQPTPCSECAAGMMQPRLIAYYTWLGNELVTVPNFPAWVCDVCGRREYDEQAIAWLNMMLNPNAGKPTSTLRRPRHPQSRTGATHLPFDS